MSILQCLHFRIISPINNLINVIAVRKEGLKKRRSFIFYHTIQIRINNIFQMFTKKIKGKYSFYLD